MVKYKSGGQSSKYCNSSSKTGGGMDVVGLKILAGLLAVLDLKGEYGSMLRDSKFSTFDVFVFVLLFRK